MTNKHNILILSAGRRVELVKSFQAAAQAAGGMRVFATDIAPHLSSACHVADAAFTVPRANDPHYIEALLSLAQREQVGLIIPTIDSELQQLADARLQFAQQGIEVVVADTDLVAKLRDKRQTVAVFNSFGITSPEVYAPDALRFPCFAKPFDGSRAIGARRVDNAQEAAEALASNPNMMFCQLIDIKNTFSEFTVDMYYSKEGRLKCVVPRKRLEVRSGEVSKGVTKRGKLYETLWQKMAHFPGARGCFTAQFFYHDETNTLYGVEINPRFGGGFPLTYASGAHYPDWLIGEYLNGDEPAQFAHWQSDLVMLRYDAAVFVKEQ